jgi:hypothetical protein
MKVVSDVFTNSRIVGSSGASDQSCPSGGAV